MLALFASSQTPKHWERREKWKGGEGGELKGLNVSAIRVDGEGSMMEVSVSKTSSSGGSGALPRGYSKSVEMMRRGREMRGRREVKESMMLFEVDEGHNMYTKMYDTVRVKGGGGRVEEEGGGSESESENIAVTSAKLRLAEIASSLSVLDGDSKTFDLEEEKVILEEFIEEFKVQGGEDEHLSELIKTPLKEARGLLALAEPSPRE